jgi:hypothetical protein
VDRWGFEEIKRGEREREREAYLYGSMAARLSCTGENGEIERRGGKREKFWGLQIEREREAKMVPLDVQRRGIFKSRETPKKV